MRTTAPPLLAILRSTLQGEILAHVYLRPSDTEISISDLAREVDAPVATVHREASRLVGAGLLTERRSGRSRLLSTPDDSLVTRPLTELLAITFGPLPVLTRLLTNLPGIDRALIYGSWAARYRGEPGPAPVDVDVLVIGSADPDRLDDVAAEAGRELRREVNIRRVSRDRWSNPRQDAFLTTVQSRPLVTLIEAHEAEVPA